MLSEELLIIDGDSPLFRSLRPIVDSALRLDHNDNTYTWRGWNKAQIERFLQSLPTVCSLVAGVWETVPGEGETPEHEILVLGCVCEVRAGEVQTIRTFEALAQVGLKTVDQLEPGIDDALEIMRAARTIAPVAYAMFIEKPAWDEWIFANGEDGGVVDKGEALATIAREGRCVLMGSQVAGHGYLPGAGPVDLRTTS
jgi:hypothetical protein